MIGSYGLASSVFEAMSLTGTLSWGLTDCMAVRTELRYDYVMSHPVAVFANGNAAGATSNRDDQLVALAEVYYEF